MIEIIIKTDGENVFDSITKKKTNLEEAGVVLFRLEQIKQRLLSLEFEDKFRIDEDEEQNK